MALISIIVPVYNVEKYICRCLDSILHQTFSDFELLLVDDGSNDSSGFICDEYQKKDNRVLVFHQNNMGQSAARNLALDWVYAQSNRSEWISFVDADDWIHKDYLTVLYDGATRLGADISQCGMVYTTIEIKDRELRRVDYEVVTAEQVLYKQGKFEIDAYMCGRLFHREVFREIRFPVGMIFEDFYLIPEIILKANQLVETQEELYYYFQRPDSTVYSRKNMQYIENKWKGYEKLIPLFGMHGQEKLESIMKNAYVFWTQSLMETELTTEERKQVLSRGRALIKRYPEVSGYPFHINKDLLFSFYPVAGHFYRAMSKIKRIVKGDSI